MVSSKGFKKGGLTMCECECAGGWIMLAMRGSLELKNVLGGLMMACGLVYG